MSDIHDKRPREREREGEREREEKGERRNTRSNTRNEDMKRAMRALKQRQKAASVAAAREATAAALQVINDDNDSDDNDDDNENDGGDEGDGDGDDGDGGDGGGEEKEERAKKKKQKQKKKKKMRNAMKKKKIIRFMAWNINGWRDTQATKNKINRIRGEMYGYDVCILSETHLCDGEEEEFERNFIHDKNVSFIYANAKGEEQGRNGIVIIIRNNAIEEKEIKEDMLRGRWIQMKIRNVMEEDVILMAMYAPVNVTDRKKWMRERGEEMKNEKGMKMIAGDLNFVTNTAIDKIGGNKQRGTEGKNEEETWKQEMNMIDIWRKMNPRTIKTSWTSRDRDPKKRVKTRIDRILIDRRLENRTTEVEILKTKTSDHDIVTWTLVTNNEMKRETIQRIDNETIQDKNYQEEVKRIYEEERYEKQDKQADRQGDRQADKQTNKQKYERFKRRCLEAAMKMRKKRKKKSKRDRQKIDKKIKLMRRIVEWTENAKIDIEKNNKIKRWNRGIEMLTKADVEKWMNKKIEDIDDIDELDRAANTELERTIEKRDEIDERKRRLKENMRKMKEIEEDERGSSYFYNKVKLYPTKKENITSMIETTKDIEGNKHEKEYENIKDMKRIAKEFYEKLWRKRKIDRKTLDELLKKVKKKINEEQKAMCDKKIEKEEIEKTVKIMNKNKTPGIDGIPIEFYQKFDFVVDWLYDVFSEIIEDRRMTESMRTALVKLIFKKQNKKKMENYRPISLLCVDYKILAKIITERMKQTMNAIVDVDQQGFIKGGDITGNLILVKEIIDYCNEEQKEGNMILMDFKKAYDRVDREAMFDTLTAMNYGEYFMNLVRILYTDATAIVMVNGEMADSFVTGGGVRQGCPLSPYLFIAVLELMAIALREDENYEGITEPDSNEVDKVSLFADDSAMIIHKSNQIRATRETIRKFEKATGARLHDGKTKIMKIGPTRQENKTREELGTDFSMMLDDEIERYLGEMIGNEVKDTDRHDENLKAMDKTGERWNREDITMIGRALVANTLLYARMKFRLDVNSTTTEMRKRIKRVIKEFIWKKGKERVKWEIMTRREEDGGIGVIDPDCMIDATKIMLLKRWNNKNKQPWKKWITRNMNKKNTNGI
jgi:exonuclease III